MQLGNAGGYVTGGGIDDNVLSVPGLVVAVDNSVPARHGQVRDIDGPVLGPVTVLGGVGADDFGFGRRDAGTPALSRQASRVTARGLTDSATTVSPCRR